jgi:hypothetical protein
LKQWAIVLAILTTPAWAQTVTEAMPQTALKPKQMGYAVNHPTVLVQQVLFGRAHGVALLAAACDTDTPVGIETREAYAKWHAGQIHTIAKMSHDLARWYFTNEAQNATDADIIRALNLKPQLDPSLSTKEMKDACATFAEMLRGERYDLSGLVAKFTTETSASVKIPKIVPRPSVGVVR